MRRRLSHPTRTVLRSTTGTNPLAWNAWRALRARPQLLLLWRDLPAETGGGLLLRCPEGEAVILDRRLNRRERHAVLAHELVHHERGHLTTMDHMPGSWHAVVAREERTVDREVARRLVPTDELAEFCDRQADLGEGVGPEEVMHEFDCTRRVAEDALTNLMRHERGR